MSPTTDAVLQAALSLPRDERAALAEKILDSLGDANQAELDAAWAQEAEDRIKAYEEGKMKAIPAEEVFRSLKQRKKQP
jgi:putative addiction module component (TIGR02574 family)